MALEKKKIAIAGIGTVGKGLVKILEQFGSKLPNLMVSVIASRKRMKLPEKSIFKDTVILNDAKKLVNFDDYDILVELIGGDKGVAKDIVMNALKKKKTCCNGE